MALAGKTVPYYCVSDHVHWDGDDGYFTHHLDVAHELAAEGLDRPLYLGAELTMLDAHGRLPQLAAAAGHLNYFLVGDHYIPGTHISMDDIKSSQGILLKKLQQDKLGDLFTTVKNMYVECVQTYHPQILDHPFSTFLRCQFPHVALLEDFEAVCEACQDAGTAIEINNSEVFRNILEAKPPLCEHPDLLTTPEFYRSFIRILKNYDVAYSFGSDAHRFKDIGRIGEAWAEAQQAGLPEKRVLNFLENLDMKPTVMPHS
jgi:histidinol phosphatase-like PHP family hydrolase